MKNTTSKRKYRFLLIILLIVVGLGIYIGFGHIAPYAIIQPQRISLNEHPGNFHIASDDISIKVEPDIELIGHWLYAERETPKAIMIFVHGIGGCKEHFIPWASSLARKGMSSIVFDGRAHGESGGIYCTYGFYEKKDISKIVDIIKEKHPDTPIGVWGNSLGGAIALQALEYDERIDFGIVESTFTQLDQIVFDYKKRLLKGVGIKYLSDYSLSRAGKIARFEPAEVSPIQSVKNIEQPVFIAHGNVDKNVSFSYGKQLYENLKSEEKVFELIEGAGHFDLSQKGGEGYKQKIFEFIENQLQ